ncbi:MAG: hypothetical protein NVSMB14_17810 [Isosphaeraceae bacterium]
MTAEIERLVNLRDAADRLGIDRKVVSSYVKFHGLPTYQIGPGRYLTGESFDELESKLREKGVIR